MPRLAGNVRQALASWWNLALSAGYGGYTTTDTIAAASDLAGQHGQTISFGESSAIATLFGYARRMSNAANVTQNLADSERITSEAIAIPPWARDEQEMRALPMWHVQFNLTTVDEGGGITTERKTSVFRVTLPLTAGELKDAVTGDGQAMALKYNTTFQSADLLEIHAV